MKTSNFLMGNRITHFAKRQIESPDGPDTIFLGREGGAKGNFLPSAVVYSIAGSYSVLITPLRTAA
jgi:hypothetical protein